LIEAGELLHRIPAVTQQQGLTSATNNGTGVVADGFLQGDLLGFTEVDIAHEAKLTKCVVYLYRGA
jgi:hypothetical protein